MNIFSALDSDRLEISLMEFLLGDARNTDSSECPVFDMREDKIDTLSGLLGNVIDPVKIVMLLKLHERAYVPLDGKEIKEGIPFLVLLKLIAMDIFR